MAGKTTNISIRMDTDLEAERIAKDPSVKGYNDLDELFADLKK